MCFAFVLHGAGHFVVDEPNQDPYKSGTLMLGTLNPGNLEPQNPGNPGNLQLWNRGILQTLGTLPDNIATLEPWSLLLSCKAGLICQSME